MFLPFSTSDRISDSASATFEMMLLAPWVVAMRIPNVVYEAATPWHAPAGRRGGEGERAIIEKTAAIVESYGVVQAEILGAWSNLVTSAMLGDVPNVVSLSRSLQDISDASMQPMARRVRANYSRLKSQKW